VKRSNWNDFFVVLLRTHRDSFQPPNGLRQYVRYQPGPCKSIDFVISSVLRRGVGDRVQMCRYRLFRAEPGRWRAVRISMRASALGKGARPRHRLRLTPTGNGLPQDLQGSRSIRRQVTRRRRMRFPAPASARIDPVRTPIFPSQQEYVCIFILWLLTIPIAPYRCCTYIRLRVLAAAGTTTYAYVRAAAFLVVMVWRVSGVIRNNCTYVAVVYVLSCRYRSIWSWVAACGRVRLGQLSEQRSELKSLHGPRTE
jgi:hypothetical protein